MIAGHLKASILEPFTTYLFKVLIFIPKRNVLSNYTGDNTLYTIGKAMILVSTETSIRKKCHYVYFGNGGQNDDFIFNGIKLSNNCEEKILGVIIDKELKFEPHIRNMCIKAARKKVQSQKFLGYKASKKFFLKVLNF